MDAAAGQRLERLIDAARFFALPSEANPPRQVAADYLRYTVTIERGDERHSVRFVDPIEDEDQRALVVALRAMANDRREEKRGERDDDR